MNRLNRQFAQFDWLSLSIILILSALSCIFVLSATYTHTTFFSLFFQKQVFGIITGLFIYLLFSFIDYRVLCNEGFYGYFLIIGMLIFTIIKGHVGMGAQRWINLGIIKFQPSELVKLFLPAFITHYFTHEASLKNHNKFFLFLTMTGILFATCLLVLKQPDLGTAIIIMLSGLILLWMTGIGKKFFIYSIIICSITSPIAWKFLKPYQKKRIEVFLGGGDKARERYQIEQAKIAIGSGGLFGKGLLKGTQTNLKFLPESRTDFIFAVICEEWGFTGAMIIILLYCILFVRILFQIGQLYNFAAKLLAIGLIIHIVLSTIINICMVIGLLPIVGIPLPLMSYGITNIWITLASFGWINGILRRRHLLE